METQLKLALAPSYLHPVDPNILWEKFQRLSRNKAFIKDLKKQPKGKIFFEVSDANFKELIGLLKILSKELSGGERSAYFDLYPRDLPGHKITIAPSN